MSKDSWSKPAAELIASQLGLPDVQPLLDGNVLRGAQDAARELLASHGHLTGGTGGSSFARAWNAWKTFLSLEDRSEIRFVSPWGAPVSQVEASRQVFATSGPIDATEQGVLFHLHTNRPLGRWFRLADAVAIAGLQASTSPRRRAVLVLASAGSTLDQSLYDEPDVRDYLLRLGVPLRVWRLDAEVSSESPPWGSVERNIAISSGGEGGTLPEAYSELASALSRQRIVWIAGRFLPHQIELADEADGVRLVSAVAGAAP